MTSDSIIEVEALGHSYADRVALDGLDFTVEAGEMFGILGPNGSGKTTLFRILSTLLAPTSGRARVFGIDVQVDPDAIRQRAGVVFQSSSVDGKLTLVENLRHHGYLYGLWRRPLQHRIADMLQRFGLSDRANDPVESLSGGLRRRLDIAKSLLHRPDLLLLDEPTAGLDPNARRDLWSYLEALRAETLSQAAPITIVFTTHLTDEAEGCHRLAILDNGSMVALDTPPGLKRIIGGDVIFAQSRAPEELRQALRDQFGEESSMLGDVVRLEREGAHIFITELVEAFPGLISAITVRKPTLEDVFTRRTGHRFMESTEEPHHHDVL